MINDFIEAQPIHGSAVLLSVFYLNKKVILSDDPPTNLQLLARFVAFASPREANYSVSPVQPEPSNSPLDCCI